MSFLTDADFLSINNSTNAPALLRPDPTKVQLFFTRLMTGWAERVKLYRSRGKHQKTASVPPACL